MKNRFTLLMALCLFITSATAQVVDVVTGLSDPGSVALDGNTLYFNQNTANKISKIDISLPTPTVIDVATGISNPWGILLNGNDLYITAQGTGNVVKIDVTQPSPTPVTVTSGLLTGLQSMFLDGNDLYIASSATAPGIYKVDITQPLPITPTLVLGGAANALIKFGDMLYFSDFQGGTISKIDLSQPSPTPTIVIAGLSGPVGLTLNGQFLYISENTADKISRIDLSVPTPTSELVTTGVVGPAYCAFNGIDLYIAEYEGNKISKLQIGQPVFSALGTVCQGSNNTGLGGASPTGGTYSGTGVTDDGNGQTFTFDANVAGVGAATVTYTAAGGSGLMATSDITVSTAVSVATSSTEDDGSTNGTATATPSGGTPPYQYLWSNTATTAITFNLAADTYQVTITDANGCTSTESIVVNSSAVSDDDCAGANDINSLFGGAVNTPMTSSLYDNTGYTAAGDPTTGLECFAEAPGSLEKTIWYTFTGDGNTYRIRSVQCSATDYIDNGDTQVAVYSGDCNTLTAVACNDGEDALNSVLNVQLDMETTQGTVYYMLIDGFDGSDGEFCLEVTQIDPNGIADVEYQTINIYPNPTKGMISWTGINAQTAKVYDNTGRSVLTVSQPNGTIDITALTEGIYIMMLHTEDGVYTSRVIKQ
ncbi:MAG: T9SS type A sorting domain-containing protein [Flavobacteriales bacterium]|nr:T9SS type A sorting domain-containing protein [Flavobacteriales bacterium]